MISFEQIINKLNKKAMTLKEQYKKETNLEVYILDPFTGDFDNTNYVEWLEAKINYTRCCTEFADGKCKPMVNADWTYLRCECGKRFEPKG